MLSLTPLTHDCAASDPPSAHDWADLHAATRKTEGWLGILVRTHAEQDDPADDFRTIGAAVTTLQRLINSRKAVDLWRLTLERKIFEQREYQRLLEEQEERRLAREAARRKEQEPNQAHWVDGGELLEENADGEIAGGFGNGSPGASSRASLRRRQAAALQDDSATHPNALSEENENDASPSECDDDAQDNETDHAGAGESAASQTGGDGAEHDGDEGDDLDDDWDTDEWDDDDWDDDEDEGSGDGEDDSDDA